MKVSIGHLMENPDSPYKWRVFLEDSPYCYTLNPDQDALADSIYPNTVVVRYEPQDQFCRIIPTAEIEKLCEISEVYFKEHTSKTGSPFDSMLLRLKDLIANGDPALFLGGDKPSLLGCVKWFRNNTSYGLYESKTIIENNREMLGL
jgi:hypothetical protein